MPGLTHDVTLYRSVAVPSGDTYCGWRCACGWDGVEATASLAAQQFAEHYALALQQDAPKVTRHAPDHDGGRTLTPDTIRKSEQAVVLALYFGSVRDDAPDDEPLTDLGIAAAARRDSILQFVGEFSPSRLRTARVEVERAGLVKKHSLVQRGGGGRRMQAFVLTDAGRDMAHRLVAGVS